METEDISTGSMDHLAGNDLASSSGYDYQTLSA